MSISHDEIEIENYTHSVDAVSDIDTENIPVLKSDTEYSYFFSKHLLKNSPCIIENITLPWQCNRLWVSDNSINVDYLVKEYGALQAPVADCNTITYNSHCKEDIKVKEYMEYFIKPRTRILYLKDWHLKRVRPHDQFYEVPYFFASDWLNEYALDHGEDDFMFVYMGPAESWTPLHADVYSSYSWSVNVIGLKKWILFPPGEEEKLKDSLGNFPLQFNLKDLKNVKYYEIFQRKGDALFVPSGWHHQVTNIQDTISINHNWINGCNIHIVWKALEDNLKLVEHEIQEFKSTPDFENQCQLMLKSLFGMDYESFAKLLLYIAEKRISELKGTQNLIFNKYVFGMNFLKFDLICILNIINAIIENIKYYEKYISQNIKSSMTNVQSYILEVMNL